MPALETIPPLRPGACQVWWAAAVAAGWHDDLLDDAERGRRDRYVQEVDRRRFTAGAALLRLLVAAHLGGSPDALAVDRTCERCGEPHGKPRVRAARAPAISVAHSGDWVVVALGRVRALGVDVERTNAVRDADALARSVLSPAESAHYSRLAAGDRPLALLTYWARKEAVVKATGDGLRAALPELTVTPPAAPPAVVAWRSRPELASRIHMRALAAPPGYVACLTSLHDPLADVVESDGSRLLDGRSRPRVRPAPSVAAAVR